MYLGEAQAAMVSFLVAPLTAPTNAGLIFGRKKQLFKPGSQWPSEFPVLARYSPCFLLSFLFSFSLSSRSSLPAPGVRRGVFMPLVVGQIILSPENIDLSTYCKMATTEHA